MCFALRVWRSVYFDTLCFLKINARIKKNCQPNIQVANAVSREKPGGELEQRAVAFSDVQSGTRVSFSTELGSFTVKFSF